MDGRSFLLLSLLLPPTLAILCYTSNYFHPGGNNSNFSINASEAPYKPNKCALEVVFTNVSTCDLRMAMVIRDNAEPGYLKQSKSGEKKEEQEEVPEEEIKEKTTTKTTTTTVRTTTRRTTRKTRVPWKRKTTGTGARMTSTMAEPKTTFSRSSDTSSQDTTELTSDHLTTSLTTSEVEANSTNETRFTNTTESNSTEETSLSVGTSTRTPLNNEMNTTTSSNLVMASNFTSDQLTNSSIASVVETTVSQMIGISQATVGETNGTTITSDHETTASSGPEITMMAANMKANSSTSSESGTTAFDVWAFIAGQLNITLPYPITPSEQQSSDSTTTQSQIITETGSYEIPFDDIENVRPPDLEDLFKSNYLAKLQLKTARKECMAEVPKEMYNECLEGKKEGMLWIHYKASIQNRITGKCIEKYGNDAEKVDNCMTANIMKADEYTDKLMKKRASAAEDKTPLGEKDIYYNVVFVCDEDFCNKNLQFTTLQMTENFDMAKYKCIDKVKEEFLAVYIATIANFTGKNESEILGYEVNTEEPVTTSTKQYVPPRHDVPEHISSNLICGVFIGLMVIARCALFLRNKCRYRHNKEYLP